jgi:ABC-type sulfate transport system permease subunit
VFQPDFAHALKMTLMLAAVSVPLNSVFGTVAAILITRNEFPGKVRASHGCGLLVTRRQGFAK